VYDVFKQHRLLKLVGLALGLLLVSYLVYAGTSIYSSRGIGLSSLIGSYYDGIEHQVDIDEDGHGRLVSGDYSVAFIYSYGEGSFACTAADSNTWTLKVVDQGNLYCTYDGHYLVREAAE
jgi:hypothetical protein